MTVTQNETVTSALPGTTVEHVLTLDCPETRGIVHAVSGFLLEHGCDIIDNKQFDSQLDHHFFMRIHFASDGDQSTIDSLRDAFAPVAEKFGMRWQLQRHGAKRRVLIMASKFEHCLNDLLFRPRIGELPIDILGVMSNHDDLDTRRLYASPSPPPRHATPTAKAAAPLLEPVEEYDTELVVLARYMQILSDDLGQAERRCRPINIHHSFLPSFKGARPYHQAYERGVKTVGATAHYVTGDLDEGPIISQQVQDVDHAYRPDDLVAAGRDTECKALSDAIRWHCEGRVVVQGSRTVVLK